MIQSKYPSTYYRVSAKAIIRDEDGRVLLAKENGDVWNLPGGGVDHEETAVDTLKRELREELNITKPFTAQLVATDTFFVHQLEAWLLWLVYEVKFDSFDYSLGEEVNAAEFIDIETFANSDVREERVIYRVMKNIQS